MTETKEAGALRWALVKSFRGGHHFFRSEVSGRIAIADQSIRDMHNPASADDGLIWVDSSAPIVIEKNGRCLGTFLPVQRKGGEKCTSISLEEAAFCIEQLGMALSITGIGRVQKVS